MPVPASSAWLHRVRDRLQVGIGEVIGQSELVREDAAHVGVHGGHVVVVREDEDGARRVRADARERAQAVEAARKLGGAAVPVRLPRSSPRLLQPPRPGVVAEALPAPEHVGERRRCEAFERRVRATSPAIRRNGASPEAPGSVAA